MDINIKNTYPYLPFFTHITNKAPTNTAKPTKHAMIRSRKTPIVENVPITTKNSQILM